MDVCFYYLRKLLRYGPGIKISATTTDFAFDSQVRGLYDDFLKDPLVLVKQTSLFSYPIGLYMPCNTSWREVDHVLMPLRMYNSAHWILCHFDNKEMCLNIYNSYTKIVKEPVVLEAVRPFLVMIPYLLFHTGFFEGKNIPEQEALKPLVVKMVPKLPQQKNDGDCGNYVIKYAEYFINEMLNEMPKIFNIAQVRKHLATQFGIKFSAEAERTVIDLQAQFGNKWVRIAAYLPGRTDNDVKNFWSSRKKRLARSLQTTPSSSSKQVEASGVHAPSSR
ncbi:Uncharacterized protein Adt_45883 [Abeliophyllum distichum]|uniref:Uncharacterized protein n=1 Tax=Abeliophyllum distichum TaxID=126358 RepID=A0ABD1P3R9_9LAMI